MGKKMTFEETNKEYSRMRAGELIIFCREFHILKQQENYNKKTPKKRNEKEI